MYQYIEFAEKGNTAIISLNRPDRYNAMNEEMCKELLNCLRTVSTAGKHKSLVLTGAGKGFCSGLDINSVDLSASVNATEVVYNYYNPIVKEIRNLPIPVICKLNGPAAGAGASLVIACDMVLASEEATISMAFVNIGLVPDTGAAYFLPRLAGSLKAFELFALGTKISASEALQYGLVNKIYKHEDLGKAVDQLTAYFEHAPSKSIALIKKMVTESSENSLFSMLDMEAKFQEKAANTEDFAEGIQAFKGKRRPNFQGK